VSQSEIGKWLQIDCAGKLCDVFEPATAGAYAVMFLHGVGMETLAGNPVWTQLLESSGLRAVCPHGKRAWWSNRICSEFDSQLTAERHILQNVLALLRDRWSIEPPRIALVGISMGGQGALRLAMKYPSKFPIVASISAAIDYQILYGQGTTIDEMYSDKEAVRQDTVLLHVHPLNWPRNMLFVADPTDRFWFEGNQRLHEKLAAIGIQHQYDLTTSAGGHSWEYFNFMAPRIVDFVMSSLNTEQLRAGAV
jgi:S-formylglutathione hydrolase